MENLIKFESFSREKRFSELSDDLKCKKLLNNIDNIKFDTIGMYPHTLSFDFFGYSFNCNSGTCEFYDKKYEPYVINNDKLRTFYDKAIKKAHNREKYELKMKSQKQGIDFIENKGGIVKFLKYILKYFKKLKQYDRLSIFDYDGLMGTCRPYHEGFYISCEIGGFFDNLDRLSSICYEKDDDGKWIFEISISYPIYTGSKEYKILVGPKYKKHLDKLNKKIHRFHYLKEKYILDSLNNNIKKKNLIQRIKDKLYSKEYENDIIDDILLELKDYKSSINIENTFKEDGFNIMINFSDKRMDNEFLELVKDVSERLLDYTNKHPKFIIKLSTNSGGNKFLFFDLNNYDEIIELFNLMFDNITILEFDIKFR